MAVVKKNNRVPNLDRVFFWDFDIDAMNFDKAYKTIIARIIERGGQYEIDEIMHFYEITALSDCVPGAFGILEPAGEEKDRITTPGFMLVPGLAFDKNGNRLGYGGGFYDKYLASHEEIITAALGYDFQIVEKVPSEPHDKKMDYLIY